VRGRGARTAPSGARALAPLCQAVPHRPAWAAQVGVKVLHPHYARGGAQGRGADRQHAQGLVSEQGEDFRVPGNVASQDAPAELLHRVARHLGRARTAPSLLLPRPRSGTWAWAGRTVPSSLFHQAGHGKPDSRGCGERQGGKLGARLLPAPGAEEGAERVGPPVGGAIGQHARAAAGVRGRRLPGPRLPPLHHQPGQALEHGAL
jgi:hypothetical protein